MGTRTKKDGQKKCIWNNVGIIAKTFSRLPRIEFTEVSWPVLMFRSHREAVQLSVEHHWKRSSLEIKDAFVAPIFREELYVPQRRVQIELLNQWLWSLKKSFYRLLRSSKEWRIHIEKNLKETEWESSYVDPSLHLLCDAKKWVVFLIYDDDIHVFVSEHIVIRLATLIFWTKFEVKIPKSGSVFGSFNHW